MEPKLRSKERCFVCLIIATIKMFHLSNVRSFIHDVTFHAYDLSIVPVS